MTTLPTLPVHGLAPAANPAGPRLSVIIPNYNYQEFIGQAIDSALAVSWPQVQVIVVDDGSTDRSREVIEAYRGRIEIVHQANAGQLQAYNVGFTLARGDVVIFLDSDDLLDPEVITADNIADFVRDDLPDSLWVNTKMTDDEINTLFG